MRRTERFSSRDAFDGYSAETPHQACSKANPYSFSAAGHQTAADVDARVVGPAQPGNGREPDVGGGPDRGVAARRGGAGPRKDRRGTAAEQNRYVGRPGLRVFLWRLPGRRISS